MSLRRNIGNVGSAAPMTDAERILSATSQPLTISTPLPTVAVVFADPGTPPVTDANTTPVTAIVPATDNTLLYLGLGAGALLLLTRKSGKVSGTEGEKKKSSLLPVLLVGGGILAWYLYNQSQATGAGAAVTVVDPVTGVATAAVTPVQTGITVEPSVTLPADGQVYNQLYAYSVPWRYAVDRMTAAERQALYTYVYAYLQKGLRLYGYPGVYQDGFYDLNLYNQIKALNTKWSLGLLN